MHSNALNRILPRIEDLRRNGARVVVAIDGRGGAGKSSLARSIVAKVSQSAHIEYDWFHLPRNQVSELQHFDHQRLLSEVIAPFRGRSRDISFRRYNWGYMAGIPDGFHEEPTTITGMEVLIIEGCQSLHPELSEHLDLRIWLDTEPEICVERGIRRDIDDYKLDPESVHAAWKEWVAREQQSITREDRRMRADLVLK